VNTHAYHRNTSPGRHQEGKVFPGQNMWAIQFKKAIRSWRLRPTRSTWKIGSPASGVLRAILAPVHTFVVVRQLHRTCGGTDEPFPEPELLLKLRWQENGSMQTQQLRATPKPSHPHTATNLNNLADLYANLGNIREAEPLYYKHSTSTSSIWISTSSYCHNSQQSGRPLRKPGEIYRSWTIVPTSTRHLRTTPGTSASSYRHNPQ